MASSSQSRARLLRTAGLISAAGGVLYFTPMLAHFTSLRNPIDVEKPLKPDAVRRGAFNNSGSRDIGPDPQWEKGAFTRKSNDVRPEDNPES